MSKDLRHIIQAVLEGKRAAQKELFLLYNSSLFKSACTYLNDKEQAQGLVQETWIDIFKGLKGYDENKSQLLTWMKTILIRKAWRANTKKTLTLELNHTHKVYDYSTQIIDKMSCEEILNEMDKIPDASRMVFKLYVLEGYQHSEIAKMLNISTSTSRVHLAKARGILRERYSELDQGVKK